MKSIQLVLMLLIIGSSAVSWIVRTLKKQSDARRAQQNVDRERQESLRTGRNLGTFQPTGSVPAPVAPPPRGPHGTARPASAPNAPNAPNAMTPEERLRELMVERQRRLEELRRRAQAQAQAQAQSQAARTQVRPQPQARAQAQPGATAPSHSHGHLRSQPRIATPGRSNTASDPGEMIIIGADGVPRPVTRTASQPPARQAMGGMGAGSRNAGGDSASDERRRQQGIAHKRAETERARVVARDREDVEQARLERQTAASMAAETRQAALMPGKAPGPAPAPTRDLGVAIGGHMSPAELRRAIVLSEILSAPRSLRAVD